MPKLDPFDIDATPDPLAKEKPALHPTPDPLAHPPAPAGVAPAAATLNPDKHKPDDHHVTTWTPPHAEERPAGYLCDKPPGKHPHKGEQETLCDHVGLAGTVPAANVPPSETVRFLAMFPEFNNETIHPMMIELWLETAGLLLNKCRLGERYDLARFLMTAHNILMMNPGAKLLRNGVLVTGWQGMGLVSSKSVANVSVSYDNQIAMMKDGETYNGTVYGQLLWRILRATGLGPLYVPYMSPATVLGLRSRYAQVIQLQQGCEGHHHSLTHENHDAGIYYPRDAHDDPMAGGHDMGVYYPHGALETAPLEHDTSKPPPERGIPPTQARYQKPGAAGFVAVAPPTRTHSKKG